eukprot:GHVT01084143.1.p1 GENE.GHVT01084143.1~~GHVT01084143.1.p1  ORF type:complete len:572 (-),score=163.27 GHVT01084143.1:377-2092(-)
MATSGQPPAGGPSAASPVKAKKKAAGSSEKSLGGRPAQGRGQGPKRLKLRQLALAEKYKRPGNKVQSLNDLHDVATRSRLGVQLKTRREAARRLAANEILLPESEGFIEAEGLERTWKFSQAEILQQVDAGTRRKIFDLPLSYGPYAVKFTGDGRHLLMGGKKGSLALMDVHTLAPVTEVHVNETVRDVQPLHNFNMFAAAQKKYLYIYDRDGLELHCLRDQQVVHKLEYLPFHFLLVSVGESGELCYRDISSGAIGARHRTRRGPCRVLRQNASSGVVHLGHAKGTVSLWTPNMPTAVAEVLCHNSAVTAVEVEANNLYTAGCDGYWKVFDLRRLSSSLASASSPLVNSFRFFGHAPTSLSLSANGLLAVGGGCRVQVWKDSHLSQKPKMPLLTHNLFGQSVHSLRYCPFEDFLCVGSDLGVSTVLVPGSGLANFDSFEQNPLEGKKQRAQREVRSLLEKLPADMISFASQGVGAVDAAPRALLREEQRKRDETRRAELAAKKKPKNKMRGKGSAEAKQKRRLATSLQGAADAARARLEASAAPEDPPPPTTQSSEGAALARFRRPAPKP